MKQKSIQRFLNRNGWALAKTRALELPWNGAERELAHLILQGADPSLFKGQGQEDFWQKNPRMLLFKQF